MALNDSPLNNEADDKLGLRVYAQDPVRVIEGVCSAFTVAVLGKWGSVEEFEN